MRIERKRKTKMTPTEIKEMFAELNRHVDLSYANNNIGKVVKIFNHINELLDAEIEGKLIIAPCCVIPEKRIDFKYEVPIGKITETIVYEWTTESIYYTSTDYGKAVKKAMRDE